MYLSHRLTTSSPPSLCAQHYPAWASLQTRRRYLCDPCLLASTSSLFLPQPIEHSKTSQCQKLLGQHLRPYVTLTVRLSSCPEHLIPAFGSQALPMLPEVRLCYCLAPRQCQRTSPIYSHFLPLLPPPTHRHKFPFLHPHFPPTSIATIPHSSSHPPLSHMSARQLLDKNPPPHQAPFPSPSISFHHVGSH